MDNEADLIRQRMEETRASLTEKLETLEHQIVDTVHEATSAMTDTVDSVKEAVHDTVSEVKSTVSDTVDTVKSTFDVTHHVQRHPWALFAGAVAAGFIAERVFNRLTARAVPAYIPVPPPAPSSAPTYQPDTTPVYGGNGHSLAGNGHAAAASSHANAPKRSGGLTSLFSNEIDHLKKMAIDSTMGLVRDFVTEATPVQLRPDVGEILNSVAHKLTS